MTAGRRDARRATGWGVVVASLLFLNAATGTVVNVEVAIGAFIAAIGAWAVLALKRLYEKVCELLEAFPDVQTALWGGRDAEGRRHGGLVERSERIETKVNGLVRDIERLPVIEQKFDDANALAVTSKEAVVMAQKLVRDMMRGSTLREIREDQGDG